MHIPLLFFIPVAALAFSSGGWSETVYKWRDPHGHVRYSNISPPASSEFEKTVYRGHSEEAQAPESAEIRNEPLNDPTRGIQRDHLRKRIEERKSSIAEIEKLLLGRPGDASLTKNLMLKRKYLQDDLEALQSFER